MRFLPALVAGCLVVSAAAGACSSGPTRTYVEGTSAGDAPARTVTVAVARSDEDCPESSDTAACAQIDAIRALLFTGVPGSAVPRAMIRDEALAVRRHSDFFERLFEGGGHQRYVVRAVPSKDPVGNVRTWTVIVNHDALRMRLEDEGVVRKFGL